MKVLLFIHEAHAWEFESGFHSIAHQTYPASLLYNADVWTEVRDTPKHRSRSNWEVYHGANIPELLSLADRLFRLSGSSCRCVRRLGSTGPPQHRLLLPALASYRALCAGVCKAEYIEKLNDPAMTWEALKRVYAAAFGVPSATHLVAQLLPRLRSCCQGSDCAGMSHFPAAVRPGETDPYSRRVYAGAQQSSERLLGKRPSPTQALRRGTGIELARNEGPVVHPRSTRSGNSKADSTPSLTRHTRPKHRSRSNWEVYHGANVPELLSLADRLFRLSRAEFLPMRAEAWQHWTANSTDFFCPPEPRPALCCNISKVEDLPHLAGVAGAWVASPPRKRHTVPIEHLISEMPGQAVEACRRQVPDRARPLPAPVPDPL